MSFPKTCRFPGLGAAALRVGSGEDSSYTGFRVRLDYESETCPAGHLQISWILRDTETGEYPETLEAAELLAERLDAETIRKICETLEDTARKAFEDLDPKQQRLLRGLHAMKRLPSDMYGTDASHLMGDLATIGAMGQ